MTTLNRILRAADPLDTNCGDIDTSFPLLKADSLHRFTITSNGKKPASKDETKDVIALKCVIQKDTTGTKNEPIRAGFPVFHYLTVDLKTPEGVDKTCKGIAQVVKAVGKPFTPRQVIDSDGRCLDGAVADGKVKINPAKDGYGESNSISTWIPAT